MATLVEPKDVECIGCGRNLRASKEKFNFLVERGYDEKDAAAIVLHNPSGKKIPKQCCVVGLQTNLDPDKDLRSREKLRAEIEQDAAMEARAMGLPVRVREEVEIFAATEGLGDAGYFILRDGPFEDPTLLAAVAGSGKSGFEITDIAPIPKTIADKEGWGEDRPLALWSGHMKIIPVIQVGLSMVPTKIHVKTVIGAGLPHAILTTVDKSLLGAEILSYSHMTYTTEKIDPISKQAVRTTVPYHVMRLRKKFPEDIYH